MHNEIRHRMAGLLADDIPFAYCVVTATGGSTPRKRGTAMLLLADGSVHGTIGGGHMEKEAIAAARQALDSGRHTTVRLGHAESQGLECGGWMEVFIQVFGRQALLYIFGAGHIGSALARIATGLGFRVHLLDNQAPALKTAGIENVEYINGSPEDLLKACVFSDVSMFVIATSDHHQDIGLLKSLLPQQKAYIGMIGSRKKVAEARKTLQQQGFADDLIDTVDMPIGLAIGAEGPEEIAVSIAAKLIMVKHKFTPDGQA